MKILFHLLSGQNLPNYIAGKIINPELNFYLYTRESENNIKVHEEVIGKNFKKEEIDSWDYEKVYSKVKSILAEFIADKPILNFTGGNKIMSQAAFNAFKSNSMDCIYINSQNDEYIYFDNSDAESKVTSNNINIHGNIKEFLGLNGQKIKYDNTAETDIQEKLRKFLTVNFRTFGKYILKFASKNKYGFNTPLVINEGKHRGTTFAFQNGFSKVIFKKNTKVELDLNDKGDDLLQYLVGKWFETACYKKLLELKYFDEIHSNAKLEKINRPQELKYEDKNEFDIIAIKGIYPIIFECKSGGIKSEFIDKLATIKNTYLGRYSSVFFISYFPMNLTNEFEILLNEKMEENRIVHILLRDINQQLLKHLEHKENLR